jgi:hypothetical protein
MGEELTEKEINFEARETKRRSGERIDDTMAIHQTLQP